MLTINGVELEFDVFDVETAAVYEDARKQVQERFLEMKAAEEEENFPLVLKIGCEAIREAFDCVFGEGTSSEVFGERMNFRESIEAFKQLSDEANSQFAEQKKWSQDIIASRANSAGNRVQRRAALKK